MPQRANSGGAPLRCVPDVRGDRALSLFLLELVSGRGTARRSRVVEGQARGSLGDNASNNHVQILKHIGRRNTHRRDPAIGKPVVADIITGRLLPPRMRLAIDFDRQPRVAAVKIQRVGARRVLAAELQTTRSSAQRLSQQHFRQSHRLPQSARLTDRPRFCLWRDILERNGHPSTMLRMVPLPETSSGRN